MKIDYQDRIDEYLLNRMTDEERSTFEQDVNHDEEIQERAHLLGCGKRSMVLLRCRCVLRIVRFCEQGFRSILAQIETALEKRGK